MLPQSGYRFGVLVEVNRAEQETSMWLNMKNVFWLKIRHNLRIFTSNFAKRMQKGINEWLDEMCELTNEMTEACVERIWDIS